MLAYVASGAFLEAPRSYFTSPIPMAPVYRLFLGLLGTSCALACGTGAADDDNSSGGTGGGTSTGGAQAGGSGGTESSGGSGPAGSGGSSGGSGATASGGSPDPSQKPDPVDEYPCYGESRTYEVNGAGEISETPKKITQIYYDEAGHPLKLLMDDDADGAFDTGSYYDYDSDGTLSFFDYDNDGDGEIDSRAEYIYDANGNARSIDYFSPVGTLASYYTIEYDDQNRRTAVRQYRASDDLEVGTETYTWTSAWEYDYISIRVEMLDEVSRVTLNEHGDVASKETWADEAKTTWVSKTTISYDDLGRPVREEVETEAAKRVTESVYGESGLVIEQGVRADDKLVEVVKYEYFDKCME
jgi:hypothetical protein